MNKNSMKQFFLIIVLISLVYSGASGQTKGTNKKTDQEGVFSRISGIGHNPRNPGNSKKKQEAAKKKQKKDWEKYVRKSQQHTYDIQTADVKARMKQNKRDIASRDKVKKKNVRKSSRKAGQKYN
jgi:hypothetical protein